jgi:hypothetical protein
MQMHIETPEFAVAEFLILSLTIAYSLVKIDRTDTNFSELNQ